MGSAIAQSDFMFAAFAEHYRKNDVDPTLASSATAENESRNIRTGLPTKLALILSQVCGFACLPMSKEAPVRGSKRDKRALAKLAQGLKDPDPVVRAKTTEAFTKFASRGDTWVL